MAAYYRPARRGDAQENRARKRSRTQPFRESARSKSQEVERIIDPLAELKKVKPREDVAVADAETTIASHHRLTRLPMVLSILESRMAISLIGPTCSTRPRVWWSSSVAAP
jgi:hypothetical protein